MVYPAPLLRLVLGGRLYNGAEGWTFSLHMASGSQLLEAPTEVPAAVVSACSTYVATNGMLSNRVALDWIKFNRIGLDGRYTEQETVLHEFGVNPVNGTATTANFAPQTALAVTLRTAVQRGLAARGRYFLPIPGYQLGSSGTLSEGDRTFYATAATTFLDALNAAMAPLAGDGGAARVVVASEVGSGAIRPVTNVAVGGALDTIRSRRTSMPEQYFEGAPLAT